RAFDTLGEITVLGIAAIGIAALLHRLELGRPALDPLGRAWASRRNSLQFEVVARPLLPVGLLVSAYLFLRGHNAPGGGFIAGLVTGVAVFVQYLARGATWVDERLPLNYAHVMGWGLAIAVVSGLGSLAFRHPFLTSSTPTFELPLLGELKFASATFFDLGVYLAVVGTVLVILAELAGLRRQERG
ncbi:MAG: hydrogen gas-evolving membrane-bound hydrogenase subunit E, partial [Pseudomonadota bacterium]